MSQATDVTAHAHVSRRSLPVDTVLTAAAPVTWGTTYLVTTQFLPEGLPMTSAALRAIPAGLLLLLLAPGALPTRWWPKTVAISLLNIGFFFPLLFVAAYRLPGGVAAVVGSLQPLVIAALAAILGWGRVSRKQLRWLVLAAVGVSLTVLSGSQSFDTLGLAAAVLGTTSMACGILLVRRWGTPEGVRPLTMTAWQLLIGGLVIVPLAPLIDTGTLNMDTTVVAGYAWLSVIGGAGGYALWFRGARMLPATNTSLLGLLSPLTAAALGWAFMSEVMTPLQAAGFTLALVSSLLGQKGRSS